MSAAARCFFGKKRKNADKWAKKSAESLSLSAEIPVVQLLCGFEPRLKIAARSRIVCTGQPIVDLVGIA